ncbi:MAG: Mur ligase family protein, partial [Saprospiraceae bacterium]|nr:Mur ligase family protein [Saprospiraceae bacterium]
MSGSDDEIYEPSRSRLHDNGLLPEKMGWDASRITGDLDAIILGMHARKDNPELLAAIDLGVPVHSFPEFVAKQSRDKTRIVVAGSHGKTSTTSMIMHVLKACGYDFDYLVGAQLPEFDLMVRLSDAPVIVIEGDEYLSSPVDRLPKFLHYDPHLLVITGIAWDHMNVFPTFENYVDQFRQLLAGLQPTASVFAFADDPVLRSLADEYGRDDGLYQAFDHHHSDKGAVAIMNREEYPVRFFGTH